MWKENEVLIRTPSKNYSSHDWIELFSDMPSLNNAKSFTVDNNLLNLTLGESEFLKSPGVSTHIIRGTGVKTQSGYIYDINLNDVTPGKPAPPPIEVFYENGGDGTVPSRSLARALVWKPELLQNRYNFTYNTFAGATHIGILSNKNALSKIVEILEI